MRCIAYPFYSKPPTDLIRRYLKITKQQLNTFKERFQAFLSGELDVVGDEAFTNAIQSYYEVSIMYSIGQFNFTFIHFYQQSV